LIDRNFNLLAVDLSVYFTKNTIAIVYVEDVIIVTKNKLILDSIIKSLFEGEEKFNLTNEDLLDKYLGIEIKDLVKDTYELY